MSAVKALLAAALGLIASASAGAAGIPVAAAAPSASSAARPAAQDPARLAEMLAQAAPSADRNVLQLAAKAMSCALRRPDLGVDPARLSVIDYSRPSTEPRMWVFDLRRQTLLFEEWVAHGRNSGGNRTEHFSNRDGSFMSSLGAFTAKETYMGGNGYSLRLEGLEPGFNDNARDRAIVIHARRT